MPPCPLTNLCPQFSVITFTYQLDLLLQHRKAAELFKGPNFFLDISNLYAIFHISVALDPSLCLIPSDTFDGGVPIARWQGVPIFHT
jgi:hypothetical protein